MKSSPVLVAGVIVGVVAVLLIAAWAFAGSSEHVEQPVKAVATEPVFERSEPQAKTEAEAAPEAPLDPRVVADEARAAIDSMTGGDAVNWFGSVADAARTLTAEEIPEIESALAAFRDAGCTVGFVLYDFAANEGLGYNVDERFFSASTVKAPFVTFAAENMVDGGHASFDEELLEDVIVGGTGIMSSDDVDRYDLQTVMSNAIVYSDNTGYAMLRERFGQDDFGAWCAGAGVDASTWYEWYPFYSPRELAKLWLNIGAYIAEGQGSAPWLEEALQQSSSSFLREALGDRGTVLSKPGFEIDSSWEDMGALNDAGIVLVDGDSYVVAIMSDADYDDEYYTDNEHLIVDLAAALGATRDRMMLEGSIA